MKRDRIRRCRMYSSCAKRVEDQIGVLPHFRFVFNDCWYVYAPEKKELEWLEPLMKGGKKTLVIRSAFVGLERSTKKLILEIERRLRNRQFGYGIDQWAHGTSTQYINSLPVAKDGSSPP